MKQRLTARIPMRASMSKFVNWVENLDGQPLDLSRNSTIAYFLRLLACKKQEYANQQGEDLPPEFHHQFTVLITARMLNTWQMFWTNETIRLFDGFVMHYFKDTLCNLIDAGVKKGETERDIIKAFLKNAGIEEDEMSFESAQKAAQRWRTLRKKPDVKTQKRILKKPVL